MARIWTRWMGALMLAVCLAVGMTLGGCDGDGDNSCDYAYDGECDEPSLCDPGTDTADCEGGDEEGCDPAICNGSTTECTSFGCATCDSFCEDNECKIECE